jgi:predicted  nucleic acid-binding Zn-ribbon protein
MSKTEKAEDYRADSIMQCVNCRNSYNEALEKAEKGLVALQDKVTELEAEIVGLRKDIKVLERSF